MRHVPGTGGRFDTARICHACKNKGHWKRKCPISKTIKKSTDSSDYVKSAGIVASALSTVEPDLLLETNPSTRC